MAAGYTPSGGDAHDDRQRVEQAVRDLQAGQKIDASFDFLFRRFSGPLTRQLVRWGSDSDEARDLNQETFQRIFQDVQHFHGSDSHLFESWVGWIWRIARTTRLRSERAKRAIKRPQNPRSLEAVDEELKPRPAEQLDEVLGNEERRRVREAIDGLPEQEFKCVTLYYFQGMKTRQIAVVLRIAQGTVKAHLSHARAKLKSQLGDYFDLDTTPRRVAHLEEHRG